MIGAFTAAKVFLYYSGIHYLLGLLGLINLVNEGKK
jgi:hypothetical protein